MPFTVDVEAMTERPGKPAIIAMDPAKPPVKLIPFLEYPRTVYKHPNEPFKVIEHRNIQHEIVQVERIPSEHLTRIVNDAKELAQALKEGWLKEPYVSQAAPDPNANLYDSK